MNQQASLTLTDYWQIVVRKKWLIVGCLLFSAIVAATLCYVLPKSYRSSTLILVENQKVPEDYVKATVIGSIEERLTMIQQQVMSRTLLTSVIDEFKLYQDDIEQGGLESVIESLRKNIKVETVGTAGPGGMIRGIEAFTISFGHQEPKTAMKVTGRLASLFIEENLKVREQLAEGTSEFLDQELNLAKARLEEKEQAIRAFKSKHLGDLPQQMEANLRALDRLQNDLIAATDMYNSLSGRLGMIEKAITEYETTGKAEEGLVGGEGGIAHLHARLKDLERNLVILSSEYKDTYPDIVQTKREIEKLKIQLASRYRELEGEAESRPRRARAQDEPDT